MDQTPRPPHFTSMPPCNSLGPSLVGPHEVRDQPHHPQGHQEFSGTFSERRVPQRGQEGIFASNLLPMSLFYLPHQHFRRRQDFQAPFGFTFRDHPAHFDSTQPSLWQSLSMGHGKRTGIAQRICPAEKEKTIQLRAPDCQLHARSFSSDVELHCQAHLSTTTTSLPSQLGQRGRL